jgi:hypothetical protein
MSIDFWSGVILGDLCGIAVGIIVDAVFYVERREREDYKRISSELEWV